RSVAIGRTAPTTSVEPTARSMNSQPPDIDRPQPRLPRRGVHTITIGQDRPVDTRPQTDSVSISGRIPSAVALDRTSLRADLEMTPPPGALTVVATYGERQHRPQRDHRRTPRRPRGTSHRSPDNRGQPARDAPSGDGSPGRRGCSS